MKKFIPYILIIVLLGGAAFWFIKTKTAGNFDTAEGDFAVDNAASINRIVLTDTKNKQLELNHVNGVWMVNGKYAAREDLMNQLFDAVTHVTTLCPVPRAAHDNVIRQMLEKNVKVEVFTGIQEKPVKTYYVGGPTPDGENTYMLLETNGQMAKRPQMTYIPGFKGYLTYRYNTDEETWRTRVLYNYDRSEIKSLSLEYPADEKASFTINRLAKDSFQLLPQNAQFDIKAIYQQKYIREYLDFYSSVFIEAFDNGYEKKDSLLQTKPYCTISITENDNSVNTVNLFHMPLNRRSKKQYDDRGNLMPYDIDHFYASIHNGKDLAIVQYYVFGKLLRNYKDFFFKPGAPSH